MNVVLRPLITVLLAVVSHCSPLNFREMFSRDSC